MVSEVFQDIDHVPQIESRNEESGNDTELEDIQAEWNEIVQDDDLFDLVTDHYLSISQMDNSLNLNDQNPSASSAIVDVPHAVLLALENVDFEDVFT